MPLMSANKYKCLFPDHVLGKTNVQLQTYLGEAIPVMGSTVVQIEYEGQTIDLPLIVVKGKGPTLLGRDWLQKGLRLNWHAVYYTIQSKLGDVLNKYKGAFEEGLGEFNDYEVQLEVDPNAQPRFSKARTVPYAMRQSVEDEIDRLVAEGTLEPVEYSDWAVPIVAVWKPDKKTVRICGDFYTTINPVSKLHRYPIPPVEDLFAGLGKGKTFSTMDLRQAYRYLVFKVHQIALWCKLGSRNLMEQLLRGVVV